MPFTFTNYPILTPQQQNPFGGILQDAIAKHRAMLASQRDAEDLKKSKISNKYLEPELIEQLKKSQLYNQYYGPNIESEMRLRNAQTGETGARTGKIPYEIQLLRSQVDNQNSLAANRKAKMDMLQQAMARYQQGRNGNASMPITDQSPFSGQGPLNSNQPPSGMEGAQGSQGSVQNQQFQSPNFLDSALLSKELLGMNPHYFQSNGQQIASTPFGSNVIGQGQTELQKQLSKEDAKKISSLETTVLNSSQKLDTFNELNRILGSKQFESMRQNPLLGSKELAWYAKEGTPEQQDLVGKAQTYMGNIIKDSAKDFSGQFRVGEQALLNNMKPNPSDSINVMKGKAEALTLLSTMISKRAELEAGYMRHKGVDPLEAKRMADKEINSESIKKEINSILRPSKVSQEDPVTRGLSNEQLMAIAGINNAR